jgi:PAT family beta-lactamase induction signal transducer AmpG
MLSAANLLYAWIGDQLAPFMAAHLADAAHAPRPSLSWLAAAVSLDNVANGIAGTAFIVYLSSLTSTAYTATQYALFGTLWSLPAKSIASQWGRIVDTFGYPAFFIYTAAIGLPALLLILWFMRRPSPAEPAPAAS